MSRFRSRTGIAALGAVAALTGAFVAPAQAVVPNLPAPLAAATAYVAAGAAAHPGFDTVVALGAGGAAAADLQAAYDAAIGLCDQAEDPNYPTETAATKSAGGAAKCALVAEMAGDPATAARFLGATLADGSTVATTDYAKVFASGNAYSVGLAAIALERAEQPLPASLSAVLTTVSADPRGQLDSAQLGHQLDAAGLLLTAVENLPTPDPAGVANLADYIMGFQAGTGLFPDWSPANTTGMAGPAVARSGAAGAAAFATAKQAMLDGQVADGGFGLCGSTSAGQACATLDPTKSDFFASVQGLLALADATLFDVSFAGKVTLNPGNPPAPALPSGTASALPVADAGECAAQGGVWVVVAKDEQMAKQGCVAVQGQASALTILKALPADVQTETASFGTMVCTIDGLGDCTFAEGKFWAFYTAPAVGQPFEFAMTGADATVPVAGSSIAFDWSDGATLPATVMAADAPFPVVETPAPTQQPTPEQPGLPHTGGVEATRR